MGWAVDPSRMQLYCCSCWSKFANDIKEQFSQQMAQKRQKMSSRRDQEWCSECNGWEDRTGNHDDFWQRDFPCKFGSKCHRPGCYYKHPSINVDKQSDQSQ